MRASIFITLYKKGFSWLKDYYLISFEDYTITETDFRVKTAKIKSNHNINLDKGNYAVQIKADNHEIFTGIILSKSEEKDGMYTYQCQDWNRLYMDKLDLNMNGQVYDIIKKIITKSGGSLDGLKKIGVYEQGKYGNSYKFNPFKTKRNISLKHNKTSIEAIKSLVYSQKPLIDIHYDNNGRILFTPYYMDEWLKPVCEIERVIDYDVSIDTTNILTNIGGYKFNKLFNAKKDYLSRFITTYTNVDDKTTTTSKTTTKTSANENKTNNPYNTKTKNIWVVMDNCWGGSTDSKYMNNVSSELTKLGWKVHKIGIGPGKIIPASLPKSMKNGIYLILVNGADCEVFRHVGHDRWFKGQLLKKGCRPVVALINHAGDIRRGGKYFSHLGMAHDGTGKGSPGLKYPAGYFADCGVPFFYSKGNDPKGCAQLFNGGGESKLALEADYNRRLKGYYSNWNWSSKY